MMCGLKQATNGPNKQICVWNFFDHVPFAADEKYDKDPRKYRKSRNVFCAFVLSRLGIRVVKDPKVAAEKVFPVTVVDNKKRKQSAEKGDDIIEIGIDVCKSAFDGAIRCVDETSDDLINPKRFKYDSRIKAFICTALADCRDILANSRRLVEDKMAEVKRKIANDVDSAS